MNYFDFINEDSISIILIYIPINKFSLFIKHTSFRKQLFNYMTYVNKIKSDFPWIDVEFVGLSKKFKSPKLNVYDYIKIYNNLINNLQSCNIILRGIGIVPLPKDLLKQNELTGLLNIPKTIIESPKSI